MRLAVVALRDSWAAERSLLLGYRSLEALSPAARALALLIQHGNQAASE
jgi:hypothetical protein